MCKLFIIKNGCKPLFLTLLLLLGCSSRAAAGGGDGHLGLQAGVMYPRIFNVVLSYDHETKYHNAWEFYMDYATQWEKCADCGKVCQDSFWKRRYAFGVGGAYKPAVSRGRNNTGRLRVGMDLGTNTREFAMGLELGYEHVWTCRNGVQFVFQQKNEVTFWGKPLFKNGVLLGIRIPM